MKGLIVNIYKHSNGDSSNGGISSRCDQAVLVGPGIPEIFEASDNMPAVKLVTRHIGRSYIHAEPVDACPSNRTGYMAGGCYIHSSDSRVRRFIEYPVSLHDRTE